MQQAQVVRYVQSDFYNYRISKNNDFPNKNNPTLTIRLHYRATENVLATKTMTFESTRPLPDDPT